MAVPDMWSEVALVSVRALNSSYETDFYTIADSVEFKVGQKDVDFVANLAGGRLSNFKPMEATEVSLKLYPISMGVSNETTSTGIFNLFCADTTDTSQALDFSVDRGRTKYRVTFLVTDNTSITSAIDDVLSSGSYTGARLVAKNGFLVEATPVEYTPESGWVWNARFKFPPFNKAGTANISGQSTDGTVDMTMTAAYTS